MLERLSRAISARLCQGRAKLDLVGSFHSGGSFLLHYRAFARVFERKENNGNNSRGPLWTSGKVSTETCRARARQRQHIALPPLVTHANRGCCCCSACRPAIRDAIGPRITRADHVFSPPRPTDVCIQTSKLVFWTSPSFARVWSDIDHFAVAVNCRTSLCNLCFDSALLPFPPTVRHALFDRWQLHHTIACHDASYFPPFSPALPGARVQAGGCFSLLYFYYIPLHCSGRPLSRVIKRGFALHFRGFSATQLLLRSFSVRSAPKTVERSEYFEHLSGPSKVWFDAHIHLGEADDQLALSPLCRSLANKSIVDKLPKTALSLKDSGVRGVKNT